MTEPADLIITNADIITMNPKQPRAEAVAVSQGLITAVGTNAEIAVFAGPHTQRVDLQGGVMSPGFVEPHSHVLLMAVLLAPQVTDIRAFVEPTWADIEAKVRSVVAETPPGKPVIVFGLDTIAHNTSLPNIDDLDAFTRDHPLIIVSLSAHTAVGNSAAFALAGITNETVDPPGGHFGRREDGSLDGVAHEATAVGQFVIPMLAGAGFDMLASIRTQCAAMARAGFTTVGELLVQEGDRPVLAAMKEMPDLPIRMRLYEGTNASRKATGQAGDTDPKIRQVGLKLWVDGTPLEGKSLHREPFIDSEVTRTIGSAGMCGSANYSAEELLEIVRAYADTGFQFACHVQGDAGVDRILDVYETVLTERNLIGTDHRWRLEHCGAMTKDQFERAAALGVTCSMFVQHIYYFGDTYVDDIFGPERGGRWMALQSALDAGIRISLHNDGYFTPPLPIGNLSTAVNRLAEGSGRVLGPEERILLDEAMRAVTINAAWHLFSENEVGSIEVGKFADFAQLSADPYTVEPTELNEKVVVEATWIGGKKVDPAALEG